MRPRANQELARLRLAEFLARPAGAGGRIDTAQTARVLEALFAARGAAPPLAEVYELIADTWTASDALPTLRHLAVLDEGVRLFPRRVPLVRKAAGLYARHGHAEQADALIALGLRVAAPLLAIVCLETVVMGCLSKSVPQLNVLSIGFPVRIIVGLGVIVASLAAIDEALVDGTAGAIEEMLLASGAVESSG